MRRRWTPCCSAPPQRCGSGLCSSSTALQKLLAHATTPCFRGQGLLQAVFSSILSGLCISMTICNHTKWMQHCHLDSDTMWPHTVFIAHYQLPACQSRFIGALTRGGAGGMPRPIEMHAHDPRRFISDMLAWVHQACFHLLATHGSVVRIYQDVMSRCQAQLVLGAYYTDDKPSIPAAGLGREMCMAVCRPWHLRESYWWRCLATMLLTALELWRSPCRPGAARQTCPARQPCWIRSLRASAGP